MKKTILAPVLALAISASFAAPASANPHGATGTISSPNPFPILIGLLLPAVQKVRVR